MKKVKKVGVELSMENQIQTQSQWESKVFVCLFVQSFVSFPFHSRSVLASPSSSSSLFFAFLAAKSFTWPFSPLNTELCVSVVYRSNYTMFITSLKFNGGKVERCNIIRSYHTALECVRVALTLGVGTRWELLNWWECAEQIDVLNTFGNFIRIYL